MRVLVTGASGFLGSWLCPALHDRGIEVTGFDVTINRDLPIDRWFQGEVVHLESLIEAADGCDAVLHLAVLPQYRSFERPDEDLLVNALGTLQALRAAEAAAVPRFILTSSSVVYGNAAGCVPENELLQPITPYGVSKATAEAYCGMFHRTGQMHTTVLRIFNIYGLTHTHEIRSTVEGRFLQAVMAGKPPVIYGDPDRFLDFVHVQDVVRAIVLASTIDIDSGLAFNVGSGIPVSLRQLASWCLEAAHLDAAPDVHPEGGAAASHYADLGRIERCLGYQPKQDVRTWVFDTLTRLDISE